MFGFFSKKVKGAQFLEGATDIHCHLLAGVDDGMSTLEEGFELLAYEQNVGLKRVYLTPHSMGLEGAVVDKEGMGEPKRPRRKSPAGNISEEDSEGSSSVALLRKHEKEYLLSAKESPYASEPEGGFSNAHLKERFEQYVKYYTGDLEIRLAAEYMMNKELLAKVQAKDLLTYSDGVHVLVETSYFAPPVEMTEILYSLAINGYKPIIAHPERYRYMSRRDYRKLKDTGYEFQLNYLSLTGYYGEDVLERALDLLDSGLYDFTGSDYHRLSTFHHGLKHLHLKGKRADALMRLFANNNTI